MDINDYRPRWPDPVFKNDIKEDSLPERTIPENKLSFEMTLSTEYGSALHYNHLPSHPADLKVVLYVS